MSIQVQGKLETIFFVSHECYAWDAWRHRERLELTKEDVLHRIEQLKDGISIWDVIPEIVKEKNPSNACFRLKYVMFEELDIFTFFLGNIEQVTNQEEIGKKRIFSDNLHRTIGPVFYTEPIGGKDDSTNDKYHVLLEEQVAGVFYKNRP